MSNVRSEIDAHAYKGDKAALHWLFDRYHMASQWRFVAYCAHQRYGPLSYETHRIWKPTVEGRLLFSHRADLE